MDINHLNLLRKTELQLIDCEFPKRARILEIGGGTGEQALILTNLGYEVTSLDVASSNYANARVFPIVEYDGHHIPFPDGSFDIIFSSNAMEHIADLDGIHREFRRVLASEGYCIHLMPTPAWRFWSTITHVFAAIGNAWEIRGDVVPDGVSPAHLRKAARGFARAGWRLMRPFLLKRHGERGNAITELILFRSAWWRDSFEQNGFRVVRQRPVGLFYTGSSVLGRRLSKGTRIRLASILGSACRLYVTQPISGR